MKKMLKYLENLNSQGTLTYAFRTLLSSSDTVKTYQAKYSEQTLYIWDKYSISYASTPTTASIYSHSWDEDSTWDPMQVGVDSGSTPFKYIAIYQASSDDRSQFMNSFISKYWDATSQTFDVSKGTDVNTASGVFTHGGNHNLTGKYTGIIIFGEYVPGSDYETDLSMANPAHLIRIIPSDTPSSAVFIESGCWKISSKYSAYSSRLGQYKLAEQIGDFIGVASSTSAGDFPSNGIYEGYWYVRR